MKEDLPHIALLANPKAGSGRGIHLLNKLKEELDGRSMRYNVFSGDWPDDLSAYSEAWVVGGDGTLNNFINRFPACSLPITLFPGGSGNDYHWLLYGDRNLDELLNIGLNGKLDRMDAGVCNDKLFMNGIGIGFDGSIAMALMRKNKKPKKRLSKKLKKGNKRLRKRPWRKSKKPQKRL